jgi:hypothetical protein
MAQMPAAMCGRLMAGWPGGHAGTVCSARRGFEVTAAARGAACGGCCPYYDQPAVTVEQGLVLAAVPSVVCSSRQGPSLVAAGTAAATPCGITGPDGLIFPGVQEDEASIQLRAGSLCSGVTLVAHRYCGGRFSRTKGFSVAIRSPSATLSSGSSQKNVRTQLL